MKTEKEINDKIGEMTDRLHSIGPAKKNMPDMALDAAELCGWLQALVWVATGKTLERMETKK